MAAQDLLLGRLSPGDEVRERLVQDAQALLRLRMAERGVELSEELVAEDLYARSSSLPASAPRPQSEASFAASAQSGSWSSSGGSGAERSSVASRR